MKYLVKTLLILLVILLSLKLIFHIFDKGHITDYSVGNFQVKEQLKTKSLYGKDNYYFEITHEKFNMNFQLPINYNKAEKIINKIKYIKTSNMNCIMPIFKGNKIVTDIMCLTNDSMIKFYHDLNDSEKSSLSKFVKSLKKYNYDPEIYIDKANARKLSNTQSVYDDNLTENHYLAIENYKGLTLFNSKQNSVKLFNNDIYTKPVKTFTDKYYIVADYNEEYSFKNFYIVNIINGNTKKIRSYDDISFDSIVEGTVGENTYIFDKDAETQYKVNLKYESVEKAGTKDNIKYYNGKWGTMTLNEALDGKKFENDYKKAPKGYIKAVCKSNKTGYCYYYKKVNDIYEVYRSDVQNPKLKTYLFKTTDIDSIIYLNNYIYFINGNIINYYYDNGVRKVLTDTELEFNDDISFGVYAK